MTTTTTETGTEPVASDPSSSVATGCSPRWRRRPES